LLYVFNDIDYLAPVTDRSSVTDHGLAGLSPSRILFLNSYLYQELFTRIRMIRLGLNSESRLQSPYFDDELLQRHMADVRHFVDIARDAGSVVLIVPFDTNVDSDEISAAIYQRFLDAANQSGLPLCSLQGAFAGQSPGDLRVNALDGHPNAVANRLAAERGAACIEDELLIERHSKVF
jgi:hypothetical protein